MQWDNWLMFNICLHRLYEETADIIEASIKKPLPNRLGTKARSKATVA